MSAQKAPETCLRGQKAEARSAVRYRFGTPALFSWDGSGKGRLKGEGITRDISVGGAYIVTSTCPPPDATIHLEIFLTSAGTNGHHVKIVTDGWVLRVEHRGKVKARSGFAVESKGFEIIDVRSVN
jgi:PilZ domain